ncbi:hypothetical protein PHYC_02808 [Phycisphaerales bacterium]|nr:hypothetical protein PHYC_02808 [Phycisphaerales bacterium]
MAFGAAALLRKPVHVEIPFDEKPVPTGVSRLSRAQLVERIMELNPTAGREFLARFTGPALGEYLDHLTLTVEPRGKASVWVRRSGPPAIITRSTKV